MALDPLTKKKSWNSSQKKVDTFITNEMYLGMSVIPELKVKVVSLRSNSISSIGFLVNTQKKLDSVVKP